MEKKRVVVTGMGMVTPLGNSVAETWENMLLGHCGIKPLDWEMKNPKTNPQAIGGKIETDLVEVIKERMPGIKKAERMDRFSQMAIAATLEAIFRAGLEPKSAFIDFAPVIIGSSFGGAATWEQQHREFVDGKRISACTIPCYFPNMAAANVAIILDCKGPNECPATACSSGAIAIGNAFRKIQNGECSIAIVGGSEAALTPFVAAGFHATKALSSNPDPTKASRPFDVQRDGFVLSEGAGILILEEIKHAIKRGSPILAEIAGFGSSCDAHNLVEPQVLGLYSCMTSALDESGLPFEEISLINTHGTSTKKGDPNEIAALEKVFGHGKSKPLLTANKSQLGHSLGAAGAIEAVLSIISIMESIVPPILNLDELAEDCAEGSFDFAPKMPVETRVDVVLSNSSGFGGTNATLLFKKY